MLFSDKNESYADSYCNMDESWKHYTRWKEPDTKGYILYDSIYMKCSQ